MVKNVGGIDRILRIVVGLALIAAAAADQMGLFGEAATAQIGIWGWIGIVPLATGFIRWCPVYLPFGIKTCKTE